MLERFFEIEETHYFNYSQNVGHHQNIQHDFAINDDSNETSWEEGAHFALEVAKHNVDFVEGSYRRQPIHQLGVSAIKWCYQIFFEVMYLISEPVEVAEVVEAENQETSKNT